MKMAAIAKARLVMLYILGEYYRGINERFNTRFLNVSLSKKEYIDALKTSGAVSKQERAIYRNLEELEIEGLLKYEHNMLKFTPKGKKRFERLKSEIDSINSAEEKISAKARSAKRGQMTFLKDDMK